MKISTTTGDFSLFLDRDEDRIRELHRAGFRYIDLSMYTLSPDSPLMRDNWKCEVEKLKCLADDLGMRFVQAHSQGGRPLSDDRAHVDFLVSATLRSFEVCAELGIPNTVVHAGMASGAGKEETFDRCRQFYQRLLPLAEDLGVNVLAENSPSYEGYYVFTTGKALREFIEYVGHPCLHACWDTGHANCEGPQYEEIMSLGKELYAIHYNDNNGKGDFHVIPYLGTLNHDEVIHALLDVGYQGYFNLECDARLIANDYWNGPRRPFAPDQRLAEPQLFMRRKLEEMMYDTAKYMLETYGIFEE